MDFAEESQLRTEFHVNNAIGQAQKKLMGPGSDTCAECGKKIPPERRRAVPGCELCVQCQQEYEEENTLNGGREFTSLLLL